MIASLILLGILGATGVSASGVWLRPVREWPGRTWWIRSCAVLLASLALMTASGHHHVEHGHGEECQADHKKAGDGTAIESDAEGRNRPNCRRLCCAHVGHHSDAHADEACEHGADGTDDESNRDGEAVLPHEKEDRDDDSDDTDRANLPGEIGFGTFLDRASDPMHGFIASRAAVDLLDQEKCITQTYDREENGDEDTVAEKKLGHWVVTNGSRL